MSNRRKTNVWTDEEIHACNYFLRIRSNLPRDRVYHSGRIKLRRLQTDFDKLQDAEILWITNIGTGYYLLCVEFTDGALAQWVCKFVGEMFKPLCDVTEWYERR